MGVDLTRFISVSDSILKKINIVYLTDYKNKFSKISKSVISKTHFLEEWGVLVSKEGHISIQQPLISPLYNGKSITDLLLTILKENQNTYTYLRNFLRQKNISFTTLKRFGVIPKKRKNPKVSIDFISFSKRQIIQTYQMFYQLFLLQHFLMEDILIILGYKKHPMQLQN